jgi:hypothetical protein
MTIHNSVPAIRKTIKMPMITSAAFGRAGDAAVTRPLERRVRLVRREDSAGSRNRPWSATQFPHSARRRFAIRAKLAIMPPVQQRLKPAAFLPGLKTHFVDCNNLRFSQALRPPACRRVP